MLVDSSEPVSCMIPLDTSVPMLTPRNLPQRLLPSSYVSSKVRVDIVCARVEHSCLCVSFLARVSIGRTCNR